MNIEESKWICDSATIGPWTIEERYGDRHLDSPSDKGIMCDTQYYPWTPSREEDWEFIAHARTALPEALRLLEEARGIIQGYYSRSGYKSDEDSKAWLKEVK